MEHQGLDHRVHPIQVSRCSAYRRYLPQLLGMRKIPKRCSGKSDRNDRWQAS
nr:MAG TPA: hypothetical protein [Caudoviricetes sp.]